MMPRDLVNHPERLQPGQLVEVVESLPLWAGDRGFGAAARVLVHPPELLLCLGHRGRYVGFLYRGTLMLMPSPKGRCRFRELRLVR